MYRHLYIISHLIQPWGVVYHILLITLPNFLKNLLKTLSVGPSPFSLLFLPYLLQTYSKTRRRRNARNGLVRRVNFPLPAFAIYVPLPTLPFPLSFLVTLSVSLLLPRRRRLPAQGPGKGAHSYAMTADYQVIGSGHLSLLMWLQGFSPWSQLHFFVFVLQLQRSSSLWILEETI